MTESDSKEKERRHTEKMQRWSEEDKQALKEGALRPLHLRPNLRFVPRAEMAEFLKNKLKRK